MAETKKRSLSLALGYGVGDLGLNIYWNSLSLILVYWYANVAGVSPEIAGLIFAVGVAWDAISDPVIASLAERNRSRFGTYRAFLLYGSVLLGASFILLFWVPPWTGAALLIHLMLAHMLFRTCYTLVAVPYSAMSARITYDSRERADMSGIRMGFAFFGLLAVSSFWFPLTRFFGNGEDNSATGALFAAMIGTATASVFIWLCFAMTRELPPLGGDIQTRSTAGDVVRRFLRALTKNRALQVLLGVIFINSAAGLSLHIPLAFYLEANSGVFARKEVVMTAYAVCTLVGVPLWTLVIRRLGKRRSWTAASGWAAACGFHLALAGPILVAGVPIQILGIALGGSAFSILIWAMIPDAVEYGQFTYGERAEGAVFGCVLFIQKLSQALMALVIGAMLGWIGYDSTLAAQPSQVAEHIGIFVALVPAVLGLIAASLIWLLPISTSAHADMVESLSR